MEKEEKVIAPESEEVKEIEDLDAGLKPEDVETVKEEVERKVKEQHVLNPEQQELFQQVLEAAKMPVKMNNKDFKLGENELDIRYLAKQNKEQMFFRQLTLQNIYLKQVLTSLVDISRLLMVLADFFGVKDIIGKTDEVIDKLEKENKIREKLKLEKEKAKAEENKENKEETQA